jgi:hypothetical protein
MHRVDHTDCGELEARDLVIAGQTLAVVDDGSAVDVVDSARLAVRL